MFAIQNLSLPVTFSRLAHRVGILNAQHFLMDSTNTSRKGLRADIGVTLRLALPLILAEIGWMSMGIVDTVMVGRLPNSAVAIGATGLGQSLYHSLAIFCGGLLLGLDTFVSQAFGREDLADARHSLVNGFALACVLAPLLMLTVSLWPPLMQYFAISPELVQP